MISHTRGLTVLKNLFQNRAQLFFLHKHAVPQKEGTFDVILSPQFYWVKKVSLPVKRAAEAKKLAESVFEGSLPAGEYSYEVIAAGEGEFVLIAYNREEITEVLEDFFTGSARVQSVRFAQYECADLDTCCSIDDESSLVQLNGLLMQIPRNCTDPKLRIDDYIKNIKPTSHKVKLGTLDAEVMDRRTFAFLAAAVVLFMSAYILEYVDYKKESAKLEEAKQALIRKYNLPPTTMQLDSIKQSLFKTFQQQKKIRQTLASLAKTVLGKKEYINSMQIDGKTATVEFAVADSARARALEHQLAGKFKILDSTVDDKSLKVKIAV